MPEPVTKDELKQQQNLLKGEYIMLLNDIDVLINWGKPQLEAMYSSLIGVHQLGSLQIQLRIKALKLKIEKVRSCINQNLPVDILIIELEVATSLAEAEATIMREAAKIENAKWMLSNLVSPERTAELRKIYRQLAKQLHPDVNNQLTDEQINLWHLVKEAYQNGDLEKLQALMLVYEKELLSTEKIGLAAEEYTTKIAVLKEGIKVLHQQILAIKSTFPFTIEHQLKDEDWVNNTTKQLQDEIAKLQTYEGELTLEYQQIISNI